MAAPKFNPDEMKVARELPSFIPGAPGTKIFSTPVSLGEGFVAAMKRDPIWYVSGMGMEVSIFNPRICRDNIARAFCFDGEGMIMNDQAGVPVGGPDMFGVEWVFVPAAGGSMVKPGAPLLEDVNDWKSVVKFPDIDSWDWADSEAKNAAYVKGIKEGGTALQGMILNGYFERLISFMDFQGAALAMVDEDQQDAVKELMMALADMYIKLIDRYHKHYGVIHYLIHDDWGSQMAPFFSPAVGKELIVPAMRKVNDHIHNVLGGTSEFHCCGHVDMCIPNMIAAGWDSWSGMTMNDSQGDWEKYGDQICIGVIPDPYDPATTSEEQQKLEARKFVDKFCKPGRSAVLNSMYAGPIITPAFREELYRYSRIKLGGE
jgi:hypothetical protein